GSSEKTNRERHGEQYTSSRPATCPHHHARRGARHCVAFTKANAERPCSHKHLGPQFAHDFSNRSPEGLKRRDPNVGIAQYWIEWATTFRRSGNGDQTE